MSFLFYQILNNGLGLEVDESSEADEDLSELYLVAGVDVVDDLVDAVFGVARSAVERFDYQKKDRRNQLYPQ